MIVEKVLRLFSLRPFLMPHRIQTHKNSYHAGKEREPVSTPVTLEPVLAYKRTIRHGCRVLIKDTSVGQVENIAPQHRSQGHETPVDT